MVMAMDKNWYALQVVAGFEKNARDNLTERIQRYSMGENFGEILLPLEKRLELRRGEKKELEEKMFPGYLFIEMAMKPECWHLVCNTRWVRGFIGGEPEHPRPLTDSEIGGIRDRISSGTNVALRSKFTVGEQVRIKEGPFADFTGMVETISGERERLTVSVMVFGRSTPVELDFSQVEKI